MVQNKYIIRLSFIGLFLSIVASIVFYRYFLIEEIVLKQVFNKNTHIAKVYKNRVWDNHKTAIAKLNNNSREDLLNDDDVTTFLNISDNVFESVNAEITIYDAKGNKIITNNVTSIKNTELYNSQFYYNKFTMFLDRYFLDQYISDNVINEAFTGKVAHSLVSREILTDIYNNVYEKSLISSYIPIINSSYKDLHIDGIIEITTDITEQWNNIAFLEKRIIATFIFLFLVFFAIVMYNTRYAQNIINKQFETNRLLHKAKSKAEKESSTKTDFLANVSHELRTPLNAIIGFSEIILTETYGKINNNQYADYISDINNSGKHLLAIINDILDFSKATADQLKVENIELDLNKLSASSMRFVKPRADKASIKLIESFPNDHIIIYADPKRLKQALLNLLSNAVKFTPTDGSVTLRITKDQSKKLVYIIVEDTGIGMNGEEIPKALSSFGQVDNTLGRKYEGTGLGLPLTKKLVELMNGKFDIKSQSGHGTTITLTFYYSETIHL